MWRGCKVVKEEVIVIVSLRILRGWKSGTKSLGFIARPIREHTGRFSIALDTVVYRVRR